jgi:hypothetical protein
MDFESTIPALDWGKTVDAVDRVATLSIIQRDIVINFLSDLRRTWIGESSGSQWTVEQAQEPEGMKDEWEERSVQWGHP